MALGTDADVARLAISVLDLTDLGDDTSAEAAEALCTRASAAGVAAVCVWPVFVTVCVSALAGTDIRVATVVNFPSGEEPDGRRLSMTRGALDDGADEIDVVLPYRSWLRGDEEAAIRILGGRARPGQRTHRPQRWAWNRQGDHRVGRAPRPGGDRPGDALRHRQRCRLRQDVDRQVTGVGDAGSRRDHPRGDRRCPACRSGSRHRVESALSTTPGSTSSWPSGSWARHGSRRRRSVSAPAPARRLSVTAAPLTACRTFEV